MTDFIKTSHVQYPPNKLTLMIDGWGSSTFLHFPVMPESVNIMRQYLMTITNTEGGAFIDDYGHAPSPMTIQGTFGYNTKAYLGLLPLTGFAWTKMLEEMVDSSHVQDSQGNFPKVFLLDWYAQNFYEVVLNEFSMQQAVGRNFLWIYRLQMTMLRPIELGLPLSDPLMALLGSTVINYLSGSASTIDEIAKVIL